MDPLPVEDKNFSNIRNYGYYHNDYTDMPNDWSTEAIETAYEYAILEGCDGKFNPNGNITIAETITVASRIHSSYTRG